VLVGTLYPLVVEALSGDKISVGAPFFNLTFGPLVLPLLLLIPFGPLLAWKRGDVYAVAQRLMAAFGGALLAVLATYLLVNGASVFAALGVGIAVWLILGALTDLARKSAVGDVPLRVAARRFAGLPRSVYGTAMAHLGMGVTVLGVVSTLAFQAEHITVMKPGETTDIAGRTLRFEGMAPVQGPNYTEARGSFVFSDSNGGILGETSSAKRLYTARQMPTTEAGILTLGLSQLYVSLGDETGDGGVVVRIWWKPLVTLIWLGGLTMMAAGAISLTDRRLRIGAPSRRMRAATSPQGAKA
jgi:cytochrome c-type biogenesis protein CcmF